MFSNTSLTISHCRMLITIVLTSTLLSCNVKVGESPPATKIPEYKMSSCFTDATAALGDFFSGNGEERAIGAGWDCFSSMIKEFKSKVRCKVRERCSPGEIAQFVEDNFFDENKGARTKQSFISSGIQTELMKVKKLFLGGDLDYITTSELDRLVELMNNLKGLSQEINPSMKILTLNWDRKLQQSSDVVLFDFEAVNENLVRVAMRLGDLINKQDNVYKFDDFEGLIVEMGHSRDGDSWADSIRNYLPLVKKLKKSITGGDEESLKDNEWNLFLLLGSRLYIQFLRYYYFIKDLAPESTSLRLAYSARTIEEVFQILYDLISYKASNQVAKSEIEDLFKSFSNIWPVFKTSSALVSEIMKVKQVLIGGTDQGFSKDDFLRAQKKVNLIKQVVEKFTPYHEFYGLSWRPELLKQAEAFTYFGKATKNFANIISQLTDDFKFENGYDLKSILRFAEELDKLYPSINEDGSETSFRKIIMKHACLIQMGSDILLDKKSSQNPKCDQIDLTKEDLTRLLKKGSQAFTVFLDYYYFISRSRLLFNDLDFQEKISDFGFNAVKFVKNVIEDRKTKRISYYELNSITGELVNLELIPKTIRKTTIDSVMQTLITRVLVPAGMKNKVTRFDGIEPYHIDQIYREIDNFLSVNIFIHQAYENKINQKFDYKFLLDRFSRSVKDSKNPNFQLGMSEFVKNFTSSYPMVRTADDRLYFKKNSNPTYDKKTLESYNLYRFIAGILFRSYAKRNANSTVQNNLTDCDVKTAYLDIKPIAVDLDIISDSSGTGFIDARFIEANLFVTKSDGNDSVSYEELSEFINYIFSGFSIDSMAKKAINANCRMTEVASETLLDLACLRDSYKKVYGTVLNSLPGYVNYMAKELRDHPADWDGAFLNNLKAAGYRPRSDQKISMGDAALLPHILQYGETIFMKFDVNADGVIDKPEAIKAYPSFAQLLKKVARKQIESGDVKEGDLEALFTFILKYGRIPECNRSFVLLCLFDPNVTSWLDWKSNYKKDSYTLAANRSQVSKILGIIADLVSTSPSVQEDSCKL